MRWYAKIALYPLLGVNLLVAVLLVCCAYSPYLPADDMPLLSLAGLAFPFVLVANAIFFLVWLLLRRAYLLVPIITIVLCFPQIRAYWPINLTSQNPPEGSVRLLSYNIFSPNIQASTANKKNPTIAYLENSGADIICLQECPFNAIKKNEKAEALFKNYPYKSYHVSTDKEAAARFLCCISKYPILGVETIDLSTTGNGCVKYSILHEKDTIIVYNCHLQSNNLNEDNKSTYEQMLQAPKGNLLADGTKELVNKLKVAAEKRAEQVKVIISDMYEETSPYVVVCGDFNDSPISYTCQTLKKTLDDAFVNSGNGPGISYNRNKLFYRIDHILHSKSLKSYGCIVDHNFKQSDHYPISCYLKKTK